MTTPIEFRGGLLGALAPFGVFLAGVLTLAVLGAPDERGFWPVILAALAVGLVMARRPDAYADAVLAGMGQPIVALMVVAWLLSGVLGLVLTESGVVQSIVWLASGAGLGAAAYVGLAFVACAVVSTATGTSFGTLLVAGPLLYQAGGPLGAAPAVLMGAILAGSTWGDSISPVSDTSIASAGSQHTDVPGSVRSRLKYVVPAGLVALGVSILLAALSAPSGAVAVGSGVATGSSRALPLLAVPVAVIVLLARRRHLLEGLLAGIVLALVLAVSLGLVPLERVMYVDRTAFGARGLVIDGLGRGVGISIFTILLMGLVGGVQASGVLERLTRALQHGTADPRRAEWWTVGLVSAAVLLTTHSVVAMLSVGALVREIGQSAGLSAYRRTNLLDMTVCTWPFLLPWFLPTIIASNASGGAAAQGMPRVSPLAAGMFNTYAWVLAVTVPLVVATGWGRGETRLSPSGGRP
ncbi:MAG: hypothetical protein IT361_10115 [Gemmatimonadaceae bacterium]|nr:hypothetical protein [Gemmatimonadaceae bacterium]